MHLRFAHALHSGQRIEQPVSSCFSSPRRAFPPAPQQATTLHKRPLQPVCFIKRALHSIQSNCFIEQIAPRNVLQRSASSRPALHNWRGGSQASSNRTLLEPSCDASIQHVRPRPLDPPWRCFNERRSPQTAVSRLLHRECANGCHQSIVLENATRRSIFHGLAVETAAQDSYGLKDADRR